MTLKEDGIREVVGKLNFADVINILLQVHLNSLVPHKVPSPNMGNWAWHTWNFLGPKGDLHWSAPLPLSKHQNPRERLHEARTSSRFPCSCGPTHLVNDTGWWFRSFNPHGKYEQLGIIGPPREMLDPSQVSDNLPGNPGTSKLQYAASKPLRQPRRKRSAIPPGEIKGDLRSAGDSCLILGGEL